MGTPSWGGGHTSSKETGQDQAHGAGCRQALAFPPLSAVYPLLQILTPLSTPPLFPITPLTTSTNFPLPWGPGEVPPMKQDPKLVVLTPQHP